MFKSVLPISLSRILWYHVLYFKSLNIFEFIFVYSVRVCSNFTDLHVAVQLSQHHLLKKLSFLLLLPSLVKSETDSIFKQ